ncbi:hypothetical protein AGMMS49531_09380 [Endomicrobiia bacterium]|nr:hypothetical protein AGMMS49531_09380 [Endomicrobiia bacterium]
MGYKFVKTKKVVIAIALFSLVLSSCTGCKDKNDKGKDKTNPVARTDEDTPKSNTDENTPKSKVEVYLKAKGADDVEIRQTSKIEKEDFGEGDGYIIYENNHFYYKDHDNGWTYNNYGLYAVKRLLFVLGRRGIVDEDLWYRCTDRQLRGLFIPPDQNVMLSCSQVRTLLEDFGVPPEYNIVYDKDCVDKSTGVDAPTTSEGIAYWTMRIEHAILNQEVS